MAMKYYFGYYINEREESCPLKWSEDDGEGVGSKTEIVVKIEIDKREFNHRTLKRLALKHPYATWQGLH